MPSASCLVILSGVLCAAALAPSSTIVGRVQLSPTCPGPQHPGQRCEGALAGAVVRLADQQGRVVAQSITSADGSFVLHVAPGQYTLELATEGAYPRCTPQHVKLARGQHRTVSLDCDSGMR